MSDEFNGVYVELTLDEEGTLVFSGGWSFDDDYPDEGVAYLRTVLDGIYAAVSTQHESIIQAGQIFQAGQMAREEDEEQLEIMFEPAEELLESMAEKDVKKEDNVVKLTPRKFDPKKDKKH